MYIVQLTSVSQHTHLRMTSKLEMLKRKLYVIQLVNASVNNYKPVEVIRIPV